MGRKPIHDFKAGDKVGKLTLIEKVQGKGTKKLWRCKCDCGGETLADAARLASGERKSCGCLRGHHKRDKSKVTIRNDGSSSICWDCIRSAAPPSLQCIRDKSKGKLLPDGAITTEGKLSVDGRGNRAIMLHKVLECPEFVPIKGNEEFLKQERMKNYEKQKMDYIEKQRCARGTFANN